MQKRAAERKFQPKGVKSTGLATGMIQEIEI